MAWASRRWIRFAVAAIFVILITVPIYRDARDWAILSLPPFDFVTGFRGVWTGDGAIGLVVLGAMFFSTGFLIGRWWALPLLAVPYVLTTPLGYEDVPDGWPYSFDAFVYLNLGFWFLLPGLLIRLTVDDRKWLKHTWRRLVISNADSS